MPSNKKIVRILAVVVVVLCAAALRLWHIAWGLPELYEEAYPFRIAWQLWQWGKTGVDLNPHFFNYPALAIYVNFALQGAHYVFGHLSGTFPTLASFQQAYNQDPTVSIVLARLLNVVFEAGTICLLYAAGKELAGFGAGIAAAALGAVNVLLVTQAHLINVDTPLVFFVLLSFFFCVKILNSGGVRWYIFAGVAIGLAAATKYTGAVLLATLVGAHLLRSNAVREAVLSLKSVPLIGAILSACAAFIVFNPYIFITPAEFFRDFGYEESHMAGGHLGVDFSQSTLSFYALHSLPSHLGWILLGVAVISIVYLLVKHAKRDLLLLIFPLIYLPIVCSWSMRADRYLIPVMPFLIIAAVVGIARCVNDVAAKTKGAALQAALRHNYVRACVMVVVVAIVGAQSFSSVMAYEESFGKPDTRLLAKEWILKNLPPQSAIATIPLGIDLPESTYTILQIPFLPAEPQRVAFFYDTRWYEDFDLVIGSDFDYARYRADSVRYKTFFDYYASLQRNWNVVDEIIPSENQPGPSIWLYRYPGASVHERFDSSLLAKLNVLPESSRVSNFLKMTTTVLMSKRKLAKAEQIARELTYGERNNPEAFKVLGSIESDLGNGKEALAAVNRSLQLQPDQPEVVGLQGHILLQLNDLNAAEPSLKEAIARNRNLEFAYDDLLMIYVKRRDKNAAIDILTRHLEILPPTSEKAKLVESDLRQLKAMQ